jgi:hypothetical protein
LCCCAALGVHVGVVVMDDDMKGMHRLERVCSTVTLMETLLPFLREARRLLCIYMHPGRWAEKTD